MNLFETLRAFLETRQENIYLVGGTVRDMLLGRETHDLDVSVQGNATNVARAFADSLGAAFYVMEETFDVARVIWTRDGVKNVFDFARMRGIDVADDLRTRDFTVNALAAGAKTWRGGAAQVIDPLNGLADLSARRVRAVSENVFRDDAVRLLRAARLEADLGFALEMATAQWMRRDAPLIEHAPMERVRDELIRIMGARNILAQLRRLDALDLLGRVLPEVNAMREVTQSPPHIYNVFEHSLYAAAAAEEMERANYENIAEEKFAKQLTAHFAQTTSGARTRREMLRFILLLHDIGKPATRTVEESGRIRYFGHEDKGVELVGPALRRLKFSNEENGLVKTVIANHLRPILLAQNGSVSGRAVYRFFRDSGDAGVDVAIHAWCDQRATYGDAMPAAIENSLQAVIARMLDTWFNAHDKFVSPPALVKGEDVMQHLHLPPGPRIGELLEAVREAQVMGQVRTREDALALLESLKNQV